MKEIKFRAWDKERNEIFTVGEIFLNLKGQLYLDICDRPDYWKDRFILMQYTGLKDKNGKEIYEGDLIGVASYYSGDTPIPGNVSTVVFDEGEFCLHHPNRQARFNYQVLYEIITNHGGEIIGNIWENPELLGADGGDEEGR